MKTIAIHPDNYGPGDASSPRWRELLEAVGYSVRMVDAYRSSIIHDLSGCHGFMWRFAHFGGMTRVAMRLLPVIEDILGLIVYPNRRTAWHFDDKITQHYILQAAQTPTPRTWVFFDAENARQWLRTARFPLVLKLARGAGSRNVCLVENPQQGEIWIKRMFANGVLGLEGRQHSYRLLDRVLARGSLSVGSSAHYWCDGYRDVERNYAYFQEFLPHNEFDTRVTVIGNRAFAYRRFNRPNDFRASGSGNFDVAPEGIDSGAVKLAFQTARRLGTQSLAMDFLRRGDELVVAEVSYAYVSWMVHSCPGHWEICGDVDSSDIEWRPGQMWPEEAQVSDFIYRLEVEQRSTSASASRESTAHA